jgi:hypothetical protein
MTKSPTLPISNPSVFNNSINLQEAFVVEERNRRRRGRNTITHLNTEEAPVGNRFVALASLLDEALVIASYYKEI